MATSRRHFGVVFVALACGGAAELPAADFALQTLYTFGSSTSTPPNSIVQGADGNFYGTTQGSGYGKWGSVFRLTPDGVCSRLYSFNNGSQGGDPQGGLVVAGDGHLYGTTASGGAYGKGTIFRITTSGTLTTLASFGTGNGQPPFGHGLSLGTDGFLYGVTESGGVAGGTVFRLSTNGLLTTLYYFSSESTSAFARPADCPVQGPDGSLYGTVFPAQGIGSPLFRCCVYKLTTNATLSAFFSVPWSMPAPQGGLIWGEDACLYGISPPTSGDNTNITSRPCVFRITAAGDFTALAPFSLTNGDTPFRLLQAKDGNLYGAATTPHILSTVFCISPEGVFSTLLKFDGTNGTGATSPLIQATDGNFYGTASARSPLSGSVFRLVAPPAISSLNLAGDRLTLTWLSFSNGVYRVEHAPSLGPANWSVLLPNVTATGAVSTATITITAVSSPQGFYRVLLLP